MKSSYSNFEPLKKTHFFILEQKLEHTRLISS
uniref:Uncharacterized protein n=1 Tax=Lepeophtheirus salmonis TaxID=72036 RepID=A0A0K2TWP1_LEPSM